MHTMIHIARKLLILAAASPLLASAQPGVPVTEKIDILGLMKKGEVYYHLNPASDVADKAEEIFVLKDNELQISGRGYGYMATKTAYRDYHLVVEFKWTGPTFGKRAEKARDSGILVHCHGPQGALGNTWSASVEAQLIEGGMGDILVLSPKLPDGTLVKTSLEAEFELDRDGEKRWKKGAPRTLVEGGRINWEKRDEDWADKAGYRGKDDPDAPLGGWNTLEVISRGDTLQYLFNGKVVNEASAVKPAFGPIGIQTEAAGLAVRRYELLPLKAE